MPLSLNRIKLLRSLQLKKFRQKYNFFIAEGPKICAEALGSKSLEIIEVFAQQEWLDNQSAITKKNQSIITVVSEKELKKISTLKTPNLVLILAKIPELTVNHSLITSGAHIFCDGIQDPGNLGTIIRIADWFGISSITLNKGCVDPYSPKTIQATMGSFLRVTIAELDIDYEEYFSAFKQVYGAAMNGADVFETSLDSDGLYVIGNEGKGISEKILNYCTQLISIPKHSSSGTESLNAAVATGIICSQIGRA